MNPAASPAIVVRFRSAEADDAEQIAGLHADSWRSPIDW
jgi:hypothetical protein